MNPYTNMIELEKEAFWREAGEYIKNAPAAIGNWAKKNPWEVADLAIGSIPFIGTPWSAGRALYQTATGDYLGAAGNAAMAAANLYGAGAGVAAARGLGTGAKLGVGAAEGAAKLGLGTRIANASAKAAEGAGKLSGIARAANPVIEHAVGMAGKEAIPLGEGAVKSIGQRTAQVFGKHPIKATMGTQMGAGMVLPGSPQTIAEAAGQASQSAPRPIHPTYNPYLAAAGQQAAIDPMQAYMGSLQGIANAPIR
jgi:hypothetical protein